jgi:hypothetical protein
MNQTRTLFRQIQELGRLPRSHLERSERVPDSDRMEFFATLNEGRISFRKMSVTRWEV